MRPLKFDIYINKSAGTVQKSGQDVLSKAIAKSALPYRNIIFLETPELIEKLESLRGRDPVLIGGGDGTILACATALMDKKIPFGVLPLGTMNLMAHDLNIPADLEQALKVYAQDLKTQKIDIGVVNGHYFLCGAALGVMPESSVLREKMRGDETNPVFFARMVNFILEKMSHKNATRYQLYLDQRKIRVQTTSLIVSNNPYVTDETWYKINWQDASFNRPDLDGGLLGVYTISPRTFWDKARFLLKLRLGSWKSDNIVREWKGRSLRVESAHTKILISLDGEPEELSTPLDFHLKPKALRVLVPVTATRTEDQDEN